MPQSSLLDEIKEKYEDTARLINLRILALIRAGKYEEAVKLSNNLKGAMGAKESIYDKTTRNQPVFVAIN